MSLHSRALFLTVHYFTDKIFLVIFLLFFFLVETRLFRMNEGFELKSIRELLGRKWAMFPTLQDLDLKRQQQGKSYFIIFNSKSNFY